MRIKIFIIPLLVVTAGILFFQYTQTSTANSIDKNSKVASTVTGAPTRTSVTGLQLMNLNWQTVVNNGFAMPGNTVTFSSYGQPSVNSAGLVVFRARSTGGQRETGIYLRQFPKGPVRIAADLDTLVPYPNNLDTLYTEFPAIPRISLNAENIATRGNHKPVYKYLLPDETETRVGTNGIYATLGTDLLITGASKLGVAPGFEYFAVPETDPAVAFDVFPGSPAISDNGTIVFKGNYNVNGVGKTGVFYRELLNTPGGGNAPVQVIANSDTAIPNMPPSFRALNFGSTAPPSVVGTDVVFVGLDNEDNPNFGGIYMAQTKPHAELREIAMIGQMLPGVKVGPLTRIGEGLSFDGRYVGFWGAWGTETKTLRLYCPEDGNADLKAFCNGVDPLSIFDEATGRWYQNKTVPANQGIFVYDTIANYGYLASSTGSDFNDYVFWGYSGKPPGVGSAEDSEPPRWRSASFMAVSDGMIVFKARTGVLDPNGVYINPVDGLYMADAPRRAHFEVIAETGMEGEIIDPGTPRGLAATLPIVGLGIERDGFRGHKLAITVSMADEVTSWGGVYMANVGMLGNVKTPATTKKSLK